MPDIYMTNAEYHIRECENGDCYLKHLRSGKFFFKGSLFASRKYRFDKIESLRFDLKDGFFGVGIVISLCCALHLIYQCENYSIDKLPSAGMAASTVVFLLVNIILHEFAHGVSLRLFGQRPGKINFRLYYFLPVISVETSDVYLLPKFRGVCVCAAGLMVNVFICSFVVFLFPELSYVIPPVVSLICFNAIPFSGVKTDGYNILVTIALGVKEFKNRKSKISRVLEIALNVVLLGIVGGYVFSFFN
jgi:hypothetical protein